MQINAPCKHSFIVNPKIERPAIANIAATVQTGMKIAAKTLIAVAKVERIAFSKRSVQYTNLELLLSLFEDCASCASCDELLVT